MTGLTFARAGRVVALIAAAAIVLSSGVVGDTHALFNGETENASSKFAADWVDPPANPSATLQGADVKLAWTPGTHQVSDQQVLGYDANTSSSCTGASYTPISTLGSTTQSTYTDSGRGSSINGHWYCYELSSISTITWTPGVTLPAVQVGLAAQSVALANGGTSGQLDNGDTITLTFNQQTNLPTGTSTVSVCAFTSGTLVLGDTTGGCTSASDANSIGTLVLSGGSIATNSTFGSSSLVVASSAPWTAKLTLGGGSAAALTTPAWTYVGNPPTATLESVSGNGTQVAICTTANTTCQPAASGSF